MELDELSLGGARFVRDPDLAAVAVPADGDAPSAALWVTQKPRLAVVRTAEVGEPAVAPVYRSEPGGVLAVPTGRVFVRFAGDTAEGVGDAILRDAGYRAEEKPSWAPHSAWVTALRGGAFEALARLPLLRARSEVELAEPELLRPSAKR